MSNINIKRTIENIRPKTTVYTPVVEMIVNAIEAIGESDGVGGMVSVRALRSTQSELDGSLPNVTGFEFQDNGVGFTEEHRDSFDTLYSDRKIAEGGKGFGRFTCLKYFEGLHVKSEYREGSVFKSRCFSMGKNYDIIEGEKVTMSNSKDSGTLVSLVGFKNERAFEKELSTIAKNLVQRLLPYFITHDYLCPKIVLSERNGNGEIHLNGFVSNELSEYIQELAVDRNNFTLKALENNEKFLVRVFKLYTPRNQKSRISLVAHKREVSGSVLHKYIPEFEEEFYDKDGDGRVDQERNYIIKAYVFGPYLDHNVSVERGDFNFGMDNECYSASRK